MSKSWANDAIFYHLYPLGAFGAPPKNDLHAGVVPRLSRLLSMLDHWEALGVNALYLGPLFESSTHGYDTADYYRVDRRLGDNALLASVVKELHRRGIRVILDAVYHHVGRDFWAFRELLQRGAACPQREWFSGLQFGPTNSFGDPFIYDSWDGCFDLVKLNLKHPEVREHLLHATLRWIEDFDIDGLRLDVAESIEPSFLRELAQVTRARRPDFWLMGEMIHGDYNRIIGPGLLDSATNYECYKGLWSSLNDKNYFEIAHALKRQFGTGGAYEGRALYSFVDNHDVTRAASVLRDPRHLYPLYLLLFTMPGVPSLYYGSEWGLTGVKEHGDAALRPALAEVQRNELTVALSRLTRLRGSSAALREGSYTEVKVRPQRLAFLREHEGERVLVVLNAAHEPESFEVELPHIHGAVLVDLLEEGVRVEMKGNTARLALPPCWGRVMRVEAR